MVKIFIEALQDALIELKDFVNIFPCFCVIVCALFSFFLSRINKYCQKRKVLPARKRTIIVIFLAFVTVMRIILLWYGYDTFLAREEALLRGFLHMWQTISTPVILGVVGLLTYSCIENKLHEKILS